MTIYRNSAEIFGEVLKEDDIVILNGLTYQVRSSYLYLTAPVANDKIFVDLNLDKEEFCTKYYDYPGKNCNGGAWPEYKYNDYEAVTRVVKALFEIIEKENSPKDLDLKVGMYVKLKSEEQCEKEGIEIPISCIQFCETTQRITGLHSDEIIFESKERSYWVPKSMIEDIITTAHTFKVGDTVKVKSYEYAKSINKDAGLLPERFEGIHKIIEISCNSTTGVYYTLNNGFHYYPEVLEPYTESTKEDTLTFKVGDTVRVKSLDWYNANKDEYGDVVLKEGAAFIASMTQYCNKITTIKEIDHNGDYILEDCDIYCFSPEAIEKVEDIPVTAPTLNYDDIVMVSSRSLRLDDFKEIFNNDESPNKVECSSEFKFTVNKPKKVFF